MCGATLLSSFIAYHSMVGARNHGYSRHRSNYLNLRNIGIAVVIILLFAAIAILALSSNGAISTGTASHSIGIGSTLRFYLSNGTVFSVFLGNSSSQNAEIYLSPYPVLTNPITKITGSAGQVFNLSISGSGTADINLKIISTNGTGATVGVIQLPSGLTIRESSLASVVVPASLPASGASAQYASTTTVPVNATTSVTTTANNTKATTTIVQASQIPQTIINLADTSNEGVLMKNLSALYAEEPGCTESIYNQTIRSLSQVPSGPLSYENVTKMTPTSTNTTITQLPSGLYRVNYSVTVPTKSFSGTVISMYMDASGNISNLQFLGIFKDQNYTTVYNAYKTQSAVGNVCAAYVQ